MKNICSLIFLLFSINTYSQNKEISKLRNIISKGFCGQNTQKCQESQLKFLDACMSLGGYYLNVGEFDSAYTYLILLTEINNHSVDNLQPNILKHRNDGLAIAAELKLSPFSGNSDISSAFDLYNPIPTTYSEKERLKNSSRFLETQKDTIILEKNDASSLTVIAINPFLIFDSSTVKKLQNEVLTFKDRINRSDTIEVVLTYGSFNLNEENLKYFERLLNAIVKPYEETNKRINKFTTNDFGSRYNLSIHKISFPLLTISAKN